MDLLAGRVVIADFELQHPVGQFGVGEQVSLSQRAAALAASYVAGNSPMR